jgi:uncharacterized repeat protein (TIGR04076 family)
MNKVRITVVKRLNRDEILADSDLRHLSRGQPVCPRFSDAQEFIVDQGKAPEGFCPQAYSDLLPHVRALETGGNYPWMIQLGKVLACCSDGFRPVIFLLERMELAGQVESRPQPS